MHSKLCVRTSFRVVTSSYMMSRSWVIVHMMQLVNLMQLWITTKSVTHLQHLISVYPLKLDHVKIV